MYLAKTLTLRSLPEIGRRFGGRDHTTVLHAVRKIEDLVGDDEALAEEIELLKRHCRTSDARRRQRRRFAAASRPWRMIGATTSPCVSRPLATFASPVRNSPNGRLGARRLSALFP